MKYHIQCLVMIFGVFAIAGCGSGGSNSNTSGGSNSNAGGQSLSLADEIVQRIAKKRAEYEIDIISYDNERKQKESLSQKYKDKLNEISEDSEEGKVIKDRLAKLTDEIIGIGYERDLRYRWLLNPYDELSNFDLISALVPLVKTNMPDLRGSDNIQVMEFLQKQDRFTLEDLFKRYTKHFARFKTFL
jgi:hypothetical protein